MGFSIAAPVGPIGVLCVRRTLAEGRAHGLISGLGAATADAIYGFAAGFGLTFLSNYLISQQSWLRLIGGSFLCIVGVRTFFSKPAKEEASTNGKGFVNAYASTFLLTLSNPMTILSFAAIFAGVGVGTIDKSHATAVSLVLGVFLGSTLWWLILSQSVNLFRAKVTSRRLQWINRVSGIILAVFGTIAILSLGT